MRDLIKREKKLQMLYHTYYNLLTDNARQTRFIASSLSNLLNNLSEGIHKIKCEHCNKCYLEYTNAKDDLIKY